MKHPALCRRSIQACPPWRYDAATAALLAALVGAALGRWAWTLLAVGVWLLLTTRFCAGPRAPQHVAEMALTSALIPLLSIYWRMRGALRFRVVFV